jgi:hypothetical protein
MTLHARAAALRLVGRTGRPEVLLHAGQPKTGTTAIQAVILQQREALAANGFHVVHAGQGPDGAHHQLIYALSRERPDSGRIRLLRAEIAQARRATLLISSEAAMKAILHGAGDLLVDALRGLGARRVHLLFYMRSPFALANAIYAQRTSSLRAEGARFSDFVQAQNSGPLYRYDRILQLARRDGVRMTVYPYDAEARRGISADFFQRIGAKVATADEPRLNVSLGPVGLEAMRVIGSETEALPFELHWKLCQRLREIARSLSEDPLWGMDEQHERMLALADTRANAFAEAVWGCGWRKAIGEERRRLNVFDPRNREQQSLCDAMIAEMRKAKAEVLASAC